MTMPFRTRSRRRASRLFAALEPLETRALLTSSYTFFGPGPLYTPTSAPPIADITANSVLADFDNDGISDLATAGANTISFAKGLSDGSFEANRTTTFAGPVGFISSGRFDGSGVPSLIAVGTRGGSILYNRPNSGFRLRAISFDPTAHADINGAAAGAFVFVSLLDVPEFQQHGPVPTALVGDLTHGWRDEFVLNLTTPQGPSRLAVFSFKNRSTIVREADAATSSLLFSNVCIGDLQGTGKSQVLFSQSISAGSPFEPLSTTTTISLAAPLSGFNAWSTSAIRSFPVADLSFAVGDYDGDHRTDLIALPTRGSTVDNHYTSDSRLWVIRSLGNGSFAAPRSISNRLNRAQWSAADSPFSPGDPHIASIADLNGDGRADVLLGSIATWYNRTNSFQRFATAAIQGTNGNLSIIPIPTPFDGTENYFPTPGTIVVVAGPTPASPPALLVSGRGLIRAAIAPQPPELRKFGASIASHPENQPALGLPASFSTQAFDADFLRGGAITSIEFYVDLNHDHLIDINDILVGASPTPDADGDYRLVATVNASWGAPNTWADVIAVATDDIGLMSQVATTQLYLA